MPRRDDFADIVPLTDVIGAEIELRSLRSTIKWLLRNLKNKGGLIREVSVDILMENLIDPKVALIQRVLDVFLVTKGKEVRVRPQKRRKARNPVEF